MGQYWLVVNLDRKEFVNPHRLGAGLKLVEQVGTYPGTATALLLLCTALREPRGNGDLPFHPAIGRWAGDRVALVGDYAADADLAPEHEAGSIYRRCRAGEWTDVSDLVADAMEKLFGGRFVGEGWRRFEPVGESVDPPALVALATVRGES